MEKISIISSKVKIRSSSFQEIISNLNSYLRKNNGSVGDYELMKDIIDRNLDKEEEKISGNLALPLYLGLMGTMLGVIIGLFFMPELKEMSQEQALGGSADILGGGNELLKGVQYAMIASVAGLLLTIINTISFYRVRKTVENNKNDFLTFIQVNLLPALSQSTSNSIRILQSNLIKFNEDFSKNANVFGLMLGEIKDTSRSNIELLQNIENLDISNIAKYNKQAMEGINKSFENLSTFSTYLEQSNKYLAEARALNQSLRENVELATSYAGLINNLQESTVVLNRAGENIMSHFVEVEERKDKLNRLISDYEADTEQQLEKIQQENQLKLTLFQQQNNEIHENLNKFFGDLKEYTQGIFNEEGRTFKDLDHTLSNLNKNLANFKSIEKGINELKNITVHVEPAKPVAKTKIEKLLPYIVIGFISFSFLVMIFFIVWFFINKF